MIREVYAAEGRPIGAFDDLQRVSDAFIFPNITFLPAYGNILMYRSRPSPDNDPDWCVFELYSLKSYPAGVEPPPWETQLCTDGADPEQYRLIPRQDFGNIPRQQIGMHTRPDGVSRLNDRQEVMILNMHQEMDRYLEA